ncbi:MAG: hypothetical protein ACM3Q4_06120 [Acidobacteriota bacterium]
MGQTLLVLCAMMLLALVVLQANGLILSKYSQTYDMHATLEAVSVAEAKLDDVVRKAYDEKSIAKKIYNPSDFTAVASIGAEAGETSPAQYDDIDDFNNATVTFSTPTLDNFTIVYAVNYVSESNPDAVSSSPTFFKRVKVTVTNPSMQHEVVSSRLVVYRRYQ